MTAARGLGGSLPLAVEGFDTDTVLLGAAVVVLLAIVAARVGTRVGLPSLLLSAVITLVILIATGAVDLR